MVSSNLIGGGEKKAKKRKNYEIQTVYDDPNHELLAAPSKKTRASKSGDVIGDFLVFGDCLSWGLSHRNAAKNKDSTEITYVKDGSYKWTSYLKKRLSEKGYKLVENCMFNRTTSYDDPKANNKCFSPRDFNGNFDFGVFFESHSPLWVLFFLGTHDLKQHIRENNDVSAFQIAQNIANIGLHALEMFTGHCHFGTLVKKKSVLKIAVIVPPVVKLTPHSRKMGFDEKSVEVSKLLPKAFKEVCERYSFVYIHRKFDMKNSEDGVHLTRKASQKLAEAVWSKMKPHLPRDVKKPKKYSLPK